MVKASNFDAYQNKLKKTIGAQAIQDEQEAAAERESELQADDFIDDVASGITVEGIINSGGFAAKTEA